jgi:heptosyltransferase-1
MPAVQDIHAVLPGVRVDWVVEKGFASLVQRCEGVHEVIECELRRWRKALLSTESREEWRAFRRALRSRAYDAVIDLQGLTKSALIARAAKVTPTGHRFALANQTEGSGYEPLTRWVADVAIRVDSRIHAVARSRELCARALGYDIPPELQYGLVTVSARSQPPSICLVHGTSRADKCWPEDHWLELGRRLIAQGFTLALPHGNDEERDRAERLARAFGEHARVWQRQDLGTLADRLAGCAGAIGVDSGLSHVAVALDLPHVQIYNFDTAWRTGPFGSPRQRAVVAQSHPSVDDVWQAWQAVRPPP